ncbi:hypothetical protein [Hoyosella subflava]|uniref:hypothetical protein n=1 Tax=Hoyosella subflava TaxID=639313 RepID=UPI0006745920|nr:hypothetical protein [Hoyosella subflava]
MRRIITRCVLAGALAVSVTTAAIVGAAPVLAQPSFGPACTINAGNPAATVNDLRFGCSDAQYEALFRSLSPGSVPANVTAQGYVRNNPAAELVWQGKVFGSGTVQNRVLGQQVFPASVYVGPSYTDGAPAVIIDYAGGPLGFIRDEIREVQPGVYAGYVYEHSGTPQRVAAFVLAL